MKKGKGVGKGTSKLFKSLKKYRVAAFGRNVKESALHICWTGLGDENFVGTRGEVADPSS